MFNYKIISKTLGILLLTITVFLAIPLVWAIAGGEGNTTKYLYSMLICLIVGVPLLALGQGNNNISKRDGYLIVTLGWLALCLAAALPYIFYEGIHKFSYAFFESTSGLTTTGATILADIEALPNSLLIWRSLTQWIGGLGIIVLTVAIFPLLGVSGVELFVAESPGPTSQKIHPRIKDTAKRLWLIYLSLTILLILILKFVSGLNLFDAINHGLTTMATGGFSTKNASIGHFDSAIVQYPILIFMFLAGMNYTIIYFSLKRNFKRVWASEEFKAYIFGVAAIVLLATIYLTSTSNYGIEKSFRYAAFQIVSLITTTGYVVTDYTLWNKGLMAIFFFTMFAGACAGSTSGGIKVIRHLVYLKNAIHEFKRLLHPRALMQTKIDKSTISGKILSHILVFLLVYILIFMIGTFLMCIILSGQEQTLLTAISATATCLGNVGPGLGTVGPVDNFQHIPAAGKYLLSFIMIVGRLELFTVLILLTPFFWKAN